VWNLSEEESWKTKQPGAGVSGKKYYSLVGHGGPVYGASFSPCNRYLLSSSEDSTVRLWNLETPKKGAMVVYRGNFYLFFFSFLFLLFFSGHNFPVWDVSFSPLGYYFATASHDHTARIFSTDHVFPLRILAGHLSDVDCIAWHPNCNYVATGSADNTIRMWEVNTGECVRIFTGHLGKFFFSFLFFFFF
jgi:transcription initiation factor TFIID subunit 5